MSTKINNGGKQQPYIPKGNGDKSGEYSGNNTSINQGENNVGITNNFHQYQTKHINKNEKNSYNNNKEIATDDFRRIQEESRRITDEEQQLFHNGSKKIDETLRERLSRTYRSILENRSNFSSNGYGILKNTGDFKIYSNVEGNVFHDIFEINKKYLKNGELVDIHDEYDDATCYLSDDGLSGFAITKDGDLISVFNLSEKRGWLRSITQEIKAKAKTLDCYSSPNQPLNEMYSAKFGFKTASIMDYNMEYDHDNIAKNHHMPQVAFMVNTNKPVETKHFTKDQYDEAKDYQIKSI